MLGTAMCTALPRFAESPPGVASSSYGGKRDFSTILTMRMATVVGWRTQKHRRAEAGRMATYKLLPATVDVDVL
jgi:hypothetical protein